MNTDKINLNILTDKINKLYDDGFKTIYKIIKNNEEQYVKTKHYYLVNLDDVNNDTLTKLNDYINYLDNLYDYLSNDENKKIKLKSTLNKI